jgi:hypothetical protein
MRTTERKLAPDSDELFDNLNATGQSLQYIVGKTPGDLLARIQKIRKPTKIVSIYAYESFHVAWILTEAKLKKG